MEAHEYLDIIATSALLTRKALSRFGRIPSIEASKQVVETSMNNLAKGFMKASKVNRGEHFQFSDNMQYLLMYTLGIIKSNIVSIPIIMAQTDTVDKYVY